MRKTKIALALIGTAALALTGCSGGGGDSESSDTIKIAHVADFSGDWSFYDLPIRNGLEIAAEEINAAGGIDGHQVELITTDTRGDQSAAVRGVEEAIDAGASYLVGTTDSGAWQAQASVACSDGIPISTGDGSSGTLVPSAGDCAVHVIMLNSIQAAAMAQYALENGMKSAYVMASSDDEYLTELPENFIDAFEHGGGTVVDVGEFRMGASDYSVNVTQITALDPQPDFIYTSMFVPDTPQFLRQLRAAGVELPVYSGDGSVDASILDAGSAAEGLFASYHMWPSDTNDIGDFIEMIEPGADVSSSPELIISALGYDEMYMIKQVIEDVGSSDPADILEGLKTLEFTGVTGSLKMNPETRQADKEVAIVKVEDGEFVYVDSFLPDYIPTL